MKPARRKSHSPLSRNARRAHAVAQRLKAAEPIQQRLKRSMARSRKALESFLGFSKDSQAYADLLARPVPW